jgi:DNA polymerase-3 subunit alpha
MASLGAMLADTRGARGEIWATVPIAPAKTARLLLGRDFLLDGELAARIEALQDVRNVALKTSETRLALVG